ncbi:hypothetical protein HPB51_026708 [Rhipicephalus microplus]|uniref:Uncharacterized protein n=1 Tax=Rhipicephalus microplus TaxID=6941 RepID=A0A9J6D263_RHIMP|nr:hypothetical protein HPB51_026708 [Rhipicephalus microplus]
MLKSVPCLHQVGDVIVQFEYEGVARLCRRCCRTGHHAAFCDAAKCTVPQCVRCGVFGHDQCTLKCKHCSGDHGPSECKARTNSSAAPPVASSTSQEQVSGVAEDWEAAPGNAEGSTQPQLEPTSERAPVGEEQETGLQSAEAPTLLAAAEPSPAGAPGTSSANAPAAEDQYDTMSWTDAVRGKMPRARRSPVPAKERLAAASRDGPGNPEDELPVPKRPAATESDEESTSSTVTGSTAGHQAHPVPRRGAANGEYESSSGHGPLTSHLVRVWGSTPAIGAEELILCPIALLLLLTNCPGVRATSHIDAFYETWAGSRKPGYR